MSTKKIAALAALALVTLYFHQVMPGYEFWPLAVLVVLPMALVYLATSLRALARAIAARKTPASPIQRIHALKRAGTAPYRDGESASGQR